MQPPMAGRLVCGPAFFRALEQQRGKQFSMDSTTIARTMIMSRLTMNRNTQMRGNASVGWICSTCGELISDIEDGWVEWLAGLDERGGTRLRGLKLVHRYQVHRNRVQRNRVRGSKRTNCQYNDRLEFKRDQSIVEGLPLDRFVGVDGLMLLLSLIAEGEMPRIEVLELAKRVQIPGYEQTRALFHEAIDVGLMAPLIGEGFYMQSEIRELLSWAAYGERPHREFHSNA